MLAEYQRLASPDSMKMRSPCNHIHTKYSSPRTSLLRTTERIDLKAGPIINVTTQQARHLSRSLSSSGLIAKTKSSQTRDGKRSISRPWKNGAKQEEGWKLRLLAKRSILMEQLTLLRLVVGLGRAGRPRTINQVKRHLNNSLNLLRMMRRNLAEMVTLKRSNPQLGPHPRQVLCHLKALDPGRVPWELVTHYSLQKLLIWQQIQENMVSDQRLQPWPRNWHRSMNSTPSCLHAGRKKHCLKSLLQMCIARQSLSETLRKVAWTTLGSTEILD